MLDMMNLSGVARLTGRAGRVCGVVKGLRSAVAAAGIVLVAGCASRPPVSVPFGEWSGHGTFFYHGAGAAETAETIHREYPTRLSIRPTKVDDRAAIEIEIVSERGELPDGLGEETHLRLALVEAEWLSDSIVLYRVAGPQFDPEPGDPPKMKTDSPHVGASCMRVDGTTVLQISYDRGFVDVFRFRGHGLMKAGSLTAEEGEGAIHWVEVLVQRKPVDLIVGAASHSGPR